MKKLILKTIKAVLLVGVALAFTIAGCWCLTFVLPSDLSVIFSTIFAMMVGGAFGMWLVDELLFK